MIDRTVLSGILLTMVAQHTSSFQLIPSQIRNRQGNSDADASRKQPDPHIALIPASVARKASPNVQVPSDSQGGPTNVTDIPAANSTPSTRRRNRRQRPKKRKGGKKKGSSIIQPQLNWEGNAPDIYWRSIPLSHLRMHCNFEPLPVKIEEPLKSMEDARMFRQDSWQWDALHRGRCTTSQASASLGFLEESAGSLLGIPTSWRNHGAAYRAFRRLQEPGLRSLEDMNRVLLDSGPVYRTGAVGPSSIWNSTPSVDQPFVAAYNYTPSNEERAARKKQSRQFMSNENLAGAIRMMWGNTQEATSVLTAINYFAKEDPDVKLVEVGMCGAGLELNATNLQSGLLVGASPDGVLSYSNGDIEALEVKNHCPFIFRRFGRGQRPKQQRKFFVGDRPFDTSDSGTQWILPHYISQMQMEMLCLGPKCKSAVMIRQSATKGSLVLRMHRDDEWIKEMLYWLGKFQIDYVEKDVPPPRDFFWDNPRNKEDQSRYRRFISATQRLNKEKVEVVAHIPSDEIQRAPEAPLFLD